MGTLPCFLLIFSKGDNFGNVLFASFDDNQPLLKWDLLKKLSPV